MVETISRKLIDLAWLAGIIDGEGYLDIRKKKAKNGKHYVDVKVRINVCDVRMVKRVSEIYSQLGLKYFYTMTNTRIDKATTGLEIRVCSIGHCKRLLTKIKPFLVNKKQQAEHIIDILEFVSNLPKGGNTKSYEYTTYPKFNQMLAEFKDAFSWHVDPTNISRKAHAPLGYGETKHEGHPSEEDLSWLAGIIDGEGSMYANVVKKFTPYIDITNTDVRMIKRVSEIYTALNLRYYYIFNNRKKYNAKHRNQLAIRIAYQGSAKKLLTILIPYLHNKRDIAEKMVELLEYIKECHLCHERYGTKSVFLRICEEMAEEKRWYQDPQRLIREANIPLVLEDRVRSMPATA